MTFISPREILKSLSVAAFVAWKRKKGVENEGLGLEINQSPGEEALRHFGPALVVIRTACVVLEGIPAKMFYVS